MAKATGPTATGQPAQDDPPELVVMPFWIDRWRSATAGWSPEERACYLDLICYQYAHGPLPKDESALARIAYGCSPETRAFVLGSKFTETADGWTNAKAAEEREKALKRAETSRENGRKGGRRKGSRRGTQRVSPGQAKRTQRARVQARARGTGSTGFDWKAALHEDHPELAQSSRFVRAWTDYLEVRAQKFPREPITERQTRIHWRRFEREGVDKWIPAVEASATGGWKGIRLEWAGDGARPKAGAERVGSLSDWLAEPAAGATA